MSLIQNGSPAIIVHPSGIIDPSDDGHCHLVALLKDYYEEKLTSIVKGGMTSWMFDISSRHLESHRKRQD